MGGVPLLAAFIFLTTFQETGVMERGPYPTFAECQAARPEEERYLTGREIGISECFEPPPGSRPFLERGVMRSVPTMRRGQ